MFSGYGGDDLVRGCGGDDPSHCRGLGGGGGGLAEGGVGGVERGRGFLGHGKNRKCCVAGVEVGLGRGEAD